MPRADLDYSPVGVYVPADEDAARRLGMDARSAIVASDHGPIPVRLAVYYQS